MEKTIILALCLVAPDATALSTPVLKPSTLQQDVSRFAAEHPEASLGQVVEFANERLRKVGMNFFFALDGDSGAGDRITLQAGGKDFGVEVVDEDMCGERFATIPAFRVSKTRIELVRNGEILAADRPKAFHLDTMQVFTSDLKEIRTDVEVPGESVPHGVTPAGSILLTMSLSGVKPWWNRLRASSKAFIGDYPYLVFTISDGKPIFLDDESRYAPQDSEWLRDAPKDPNNDYLRYWRFKATRFVVRFTGPCT